MVYQRLGKNIFSELKHQVELLLLLNGWENQTQEVNPKERITINMHLRLSGTKCRHEVEEEAK
ncbi:hypothetical protein H5410_037042 [Solanum commersonii]|uniref:Uncharacterized protein n=1 Tax=Solanum commersonii TaxID=4109 RepID=A0A9J5Y6X4_SOLCO|nr:hypothetical protein H5410_037042 [Solanum commersonii]